MNTQNQNENKTTEYLTSSEAAAELYISTETLRRYEERGLIKSTRTSGGHRRFEKEKILALKDMGTELGRNFISKTKGGYEDLSNFSSRQKTALTNVLEAAKIEHPHDNFISAKKVSGSGDQNSDWLAVPLTIDGAETGQIIGFLVADSSINPKVYFIVGDEKGESLREEYLSFVQSDKRFVPIKSQKDFQQSFNQAKQSLASEWLMNAIMVSGILSAQAGFAVAIVLGGSASPLFKIIFAVVVVLALTALIVIAASFNISENTLRNVTNEHVFQVSEQELPLTDSSEANKQDVVREHIQSIKASRRIGENSRKLNPAHA